MRNNQRRSDFSRKPLSALGRTNSVSSSCGFVQVSPSAVSLVQSSLECQTAQPVSRYKEQRISGIMLMMKLGDPIPLDEVIHPAADDEDMRVFRCLVRLRIAKRHVIRVTKPRDARKAVVAAVVPDRPYIKRPHAGDDRLR